MPKLPIYRITKDLRTRKAEGNARAILDDNAGVWRKPEHPAVDVVWNPQTGKLEIQYEKDGEQ
jgi:hypothetical protein